MSPLLSSRAPIAAEASPFPREERTPPVTKINLVCLVLFGFFMLWHYSKGGSIFKQKIDQQIEKAIGKYI